MALVGWYHFQGQVSEMGCEGEGAARVLLPQWNLVRNGTQGGTALDGGIGLLTRRSPTACGAAPQRWRLGLGSGSHLAWFFVANPQRGLWPVQEQKAVGLVLDPGGVW